MDRPGPDETEHLIHTGLPGVRVAGLASLFNLVLPTPLGWGYDILTNGHPYIHQDRIPDIRGEYGFQSKEEALAVGKKVYDRLLANQIPMVSVDELRQLHVRLPEDSADTNHLIKK